MGGRFFSLGRASESVRPNCGPGKSRLTEIGLACRPARLRNGACRPSGATSWRSPRISRLATSENWFKSTPRIASLSQPSLIQRIILRVTRDSLPSKIWGALSGSSSSAALQDVRRQSDSNPLSLHSLHRTIWITCPKKSPKCVMLHSYPSDGLVMANRIEQLRDSCFRLLGDVAKTPPCSRTVQDCQRGRRLRPGLKIASVRYPTQSDAADGSKPCHKHYYGPCCTRVHQFGLKILVSPNTTGDPTRFPKNQQDRPR